MWRAALAILGLAAPASAMEQSWSAYSCSLETECLETEACAETTFALTFRQLSHPALEIGRITFDPQSPPGMTEVITDFASFTAFAAAAPPAEVLNWLHVAPSGDMHLFSLYEGQARYSLHMPTSEIAIYYNGSCQKDAS